MIGSGHLEMPKTDSVSRLKKLTLTGPFFLVDTSWRTKSVEFTAGTDACQTIEETADGGGFPHGD